MKRRQILNSSGWIAASAIFGPGLLSALQGCATDSAISSELLVFSPAEFELTKAIADTILPRTQSPSASEVKVPEFMDLLLQDVLSREAKEHLLEKAANLVFPLVDTERGRLVGSLDFFDIQSNSADIVGPVKIVDLVRVVQGFIGDYRNHSM